MDIFEIVEQWRYEDGIQEGKENSVKILLANTEFSPEKIASLVDVPLSLVKKIKKELRSQKKEMPSQ